MTQHADILARLRYGEGQDWDMSHATREEAAALIEAQADEIAGLRSALDCTPLIGVMEKPDSFRARQDKWLRAEYATAIASGANREKGSE